MFQYQKSNRYFGQVADDIKELAAKEIAELGGQSIKEAYRGIYFNADHAALYRINYCSRLLTHVLAPLQSFDCHSTKYLYETARKIDWSGLMTPQNTFAIVATVSHSAISHSRYAALCLKDAIVDVFREKFDQRPSVNREQPDVWINLHIENNHATVSIDTSGGSLHRRGYREESVEAPMQEPLAAAIIRLTGWQGERPLYDPMTGSATLLCEAYMQYCRIPAGYLRQRFGFEQLPDFDARLWKAVKKEEGQQIRTLPAGLIAGSDKSSKAIATAHKNCEKLPGGKDIELSVKRFEDIPGLENQTIVINPPYGIRMGKAEHMDDFYAGIGDFLKQRCAGSAAFIYFGEREYLKSIGLKAAWKKPLKNGGLDGRLAKFEMY
jgi:putative N6-adenine-specific DNA methylase